MFNMEKRFRNKIIIIIIIIIIITCIVKDADFFYDTGMAPYIVRH